MRVTSDGVKFGSGTHVFNKEMGRHGVKEGTKECLMSVKVGLTVDIAGE